MFKFIRNPEDSIDFIVTNTRRLALTGAPEQIAKFKEGRIYVSTVEMPFPQGFDDDGHALMFETMVFLDGSWSDENCLRYATREDALAGHESEVARAVAAYGGAA